MVPDKDLPHLTAAILAEVDYFVTYNRHFIESRAKEHIGVIKQADLVELLGIEPRETEY